jgi:hypothetical protein
MRVPLAIREDLQFQSRMLEHVRSLRRDLALLIAGVADLQPSLASKLSAATEILDDVIDAMFAWDILGELRGEGRSSREFLGEVLVRLALAERALLRELDGHRLADAGAKTRLVALVLHFIPVLAALEQFDEAARDDFVEAQRAAS